MADEPHGRDAVRLADVFCRRARIRIRRLFSEIAHNADDATYRLAQDVLAGKYAWMEEGAISAAPHGAAVPGAAPDQRFSGEEISDTRVTTQIGASG